MSNVYVSQVLLMANTYVPKGWHACDGSLLPINQNPTLFNLIGTIYGGNGTTNFALPDLRSRVPLGTGQGAGLSNYALGQQGGAESVTLQAANVAPHTHPASFQVASSGRTGPPSTGNYIDPTNTVPSSPTPTLTSLSGVNVQFNSGGTPFSILQPFLAMNYCIALQGLYPPRS